MIKKLINSCVTKDADITLKLRTNLQIL